jgi:UDP-N-acetylglucosamine diphosphorylase/glucosamine-1-phosphate N-acetyltransferase
MSKDVIVVLAAGKGTRMQSNKAKVLHEICGKPMIFYVIHESRKVTDGIVVVVGHQSEEVQDYLKNVMDVDYAYQNEQLGTGHAVKCALPVIKDAVENIVILCGDVPLVKSQTLISFLDIHKTQKNDMTILASYVDNPKGYGRIIQDLDRNVIGIIEESDASIDQKKINLINTGIYCVKKEFLERSIEMVRSDNAQGEFYLPDIVGILYKENSKIGFDVCKDFSEILGVNDINGLSVAQSVMKSRVGN